MLWDDPRVVVSAVFFGASMGALAAATADTWATEIGVLSRTSPRLITTWRKVKAGTSGGVTKLGSAAALLGAGLLWFTTGAIVAITDIDPIGTPDTYSQINYWVLLVVALAGGIGGMLVDSLLGATVQAQYACPTCNKPTESRVHRCGSRTMLVRGVHWINNDVVNIVGTLVGALVGLGIAVVLPIVALGFI
jgi:uncharacterized membrane protein